MRRSESEGTQALGEADGGERAELGEQEGHATRPGFGRHGQFFHAQTLAEPNRSC